MLISGSGLVSHNFVRLDQQGSSANGYFSHRSHTLALLIELVFTIGAVAPVWFGCVQIHVPLSLLILFTV